MNRFDQQTAEGILFTDQYQFAMAQLYFQMGVHEQRVQFDHYFRTYPDYGNHQAGYCINAGLEWLMDWIAKARVRDSDLAYLRSQRGRNGQPVFDSAFLDWLRGVNLIDHVTIRAVPEGRVVHPNVPLTVVEGPLALAQLLETPLLNILNYQILIATKAARIRESARGQPVLEFGLRRGQSTGANAGTRAALIGGADFSSNVGVSHLLGLEPKGTHAHSMVQFFVAMGMGELGAFRAYARRFPDDCVLLVDTINTLQSGVPNAITVFEELRAAGHKPVGIRLDSGDLAYLSIQAAQMLNDAGFEDVGIVLSSDLDELVIWQIMTQISQEAPRYGVDPQHLIRRLTFGVGTRLVTSEGDPALGGVYKLVSVHTNGEWVPAVKIADSPVKTPTPGNKQAWRLYDRRGRATADLLSLYDEDPQTMEPLELRHLSDISKTRLLSKQEIPEIEELLTEVVVDGSVRYEAVPLDVLRQRRDADVDRLDGGVRRLINPHIYHVSLTQRLWNLKQEVIAATLRRNSAANEG